MYLPIFKNIHNLNGKLIIMFNNYAFTITAHDNIILYYNVGTYLINN